MPTLINIGNVDQVNTGRPSVSSWITTTEAARRLGVRRETLYAYVSRGVLQSRRMPGQQESLFDRAEVESIAGAKRGGRGAGDQLLRFRGVATRVSAVVDGRLSFRGVDVSEVVAAMSFDEAAQFVLGIRGGRAETAGVPRLPQLDVGRILRFPLERRIPLAVAEIAAATTPAAHFAEVPKLALALLDALPPVLGEVPLAHPWIDTASICLIDNGLAASATAARVAASARAGVFDALTAGLAALAGALHGAAAQRAVPLLAAVINGTDAGAALAEFGSPGFGHVLYGGDDPRADIILEMIRRDSSDARSLKAVAALRETAGRPVNVDLALAAVTVELGAPPAAAEAVFQRARLIGLAAHIAEEYAEAPLRWRGRGESE